MSGRSAFQESICRLKWSACAWLENTYNRPSRERRLFVHDAFVGRHGIFKIVKNKRVTFPQQGEAAMIKINQFHEIEVLFGRNGLHIRAGSLVYLQEHVVHFARMNQVLVLVVNASGIFLGFLKHEF